MLTLRTYAKGLFLCLAASQTGMALADATTTERASAALAQGDCTQAYALLEPLESAQAGELEFDLLLGQAALKCGHAGRAVFALERVLIVSPNHPGAQIQLAQAYKKLGEVNFAKQALQEGLKQASAQERQQIGSLLSDLDQTPTDRVKTSGYIELGLGYDSNTNAAPDDESLFLPPGFFQQSDAFASIAAGINRRRPLTPHTSLFGSLSGSQRFYDDHQDNNLGSLNAQIGISTRDDAETYILALQDGYTFLDGDNYRHAYGLNGRWLHAFDSNSLLMTFIQALRISYDDQSIRDADRYVGGIKYNHIFTGDMLPMLSVSAYTGTENERASGVPHLGHQLAGLNLSGDLTLNTKTSFFWGAGYEYRIYGGPEPFFGETRKDSEFRTSAGINYSPARLWTIRPQLAYTFNNSNNEFFEYDRYMLSITLRRDFSW